MQIQKLSVMDSSRSFQLSDSPMVLGEIFEPETSVAVWQRAPNKVVEAYFNQVADDLGQGIRNLYQMATLKDRLSEQLPEALGKAQAIEDVYLVADMLTCLFDCEEVGLRLVPLDKAMCPRFHVDNIPVRLVTTYAGPGTEWLPNESADAAKLGHAAKGLADNESGLYSPDTHIQQMNRFDVGLLKGSAWDDDQVAAIHRSCAVSGEQKRVLLTLDPL